MAVRRRRASSSPGTETSSDRGLFLAAVLVAGAALVAFAPALRNGFVWDDRLVLAQLRAVDGIEDLWVVPPRIPRYYYRPLVFATYWVDRALGGETPFWFHVSVLVAHLACSLLVFALARRLGGSLAAALPAGLFFAVHPVHVESVAWMAGRADVLSGLWLLAALLAYLSSGLAGFALAGCFYLLSLLAKETALFAFLVFPAAELCVGRKPRLRGLLPLLSALAVYALLRWVGVGALGEPWSPSSVSWPEFLGALGFYARKALWPVGQDVYVDSLPVSPAYVIPGALLLGAVAFSLLGPWLVRFSALWFVSTLLPALALLWVPVSTTPVAERYLYVPSVGVALLVGWGISWFHGRSTDRPARRRAYALALLAVACAGVVSCWKRNDVWVDEVAFWEAAVRSSPSLLPQRELADALLRRGDLERAEKTYREALGRPASEEERAMTWANLGNLYRRQGRFDEAVAAFEKAAGIVAHPLVFHGLGFAWMKKAEQAQAAGDARGVWDAVQRARRAFETAVRLGESDPRAFRDWEASKTYLLLGQVLAALGEKEAAKKRLRQALEAGPSELVAETARDFLRSLGP
ncbi:MAG: hypothetical protein KatS3mg076_1188 [Candidatus Binatia bacterium]|nr:MAG: hypothetical protein KatS3mg076_1188 [Candidatus Binatia bacterium]